RRSRRWCDAQVYEQPVAILHERVLRKRQLCLFALSLLCQSRFGVGRRLMGFVASLFAVEIYAGISRIVGRLLARTILALEALQRRPRLDERAVDGKVLARHEPRRPRLSDDGDEHLP